MDSWSADQLKKMQLGGNGKLNAFLKQYGVAKNMDIKEKYNTRAAEFYREKLRAEVEGRDYAPPPPSEVGPPAAGGFARGSAGAGGARTQTGRSGQGTSSKAVDDGWGDWGGSETSSGQQRGEGSGFTNRSEYTRAQLDASAAGKETFFARKMQENASKPEGLPPSQGGKYVGFGSAPAPRPKAQAGVDDLTTLLSSTLTTVTKAAETAAKTATQVVKTGSAQLTQTLQEKQVGEALSHNAKAISEKAAHVAQSGFATLSGFYARVASTVETAARQQGLALDLGSQRAAAASTTTYAPPGVSQHSSAGPYQSLAQQGPARDEAACKESGRGAGAAGSRMGGGGFAGFEAEAADVDDEGWNSWGKEASKPSATVSRPAAAGPAPTKSASGSTTHKSKSMPALSKATRESDGEEEEWGKW